jgi:hypothetical protein
MKNEPYKGDNMKLKTFLEIPSWDWPEDVDRKILKVLRDNSVDESERLLAAELAGDSTVINDDLAGELLAIVYEDKNSDSLRGRAAISLGPALEYAFIDGFEDPDDVPIPENRFREIQESLYKLYFDANTPVEVRRRVLEASVRAPQDWHQSAIQEAYSSVDKSWKLTALFCMRFVRGFNEQVVVALDSKIPEIQYEAVCAAGNWEVDAAWSHIAALINSKDTEKYLLLAAIEAVASIRPQEAAQILIDLTQSEDEDIAEAASEAIEMTEMLSDLKDDDISDEFLH